MKWPFFKRQNQPSSNDITEDQTFIPNTSSPINNIISTAVNRAVMVYLDTLSSIELKAFDKKGNELPDDSLLHLMNTRPCPYLSRVGWLETLISHYFLHEGFHCRVEFDKTTGDIQALNPYQPYSIEPYVANHLTKLDKTREDPAGDYSDPVNLYNQGKPNYYYRDSYGRVVMPDMLYVVRRANSLSSFIESEDAGKRLYQNILQGNNQFEKVIYNYVQRGLRGELILTGLGYASGDFKVSNANTKKTKETIIDYFNRQARGDGGAGVLVLPPNFDIKPLQTDRSANFISTVEQIFNAGISNIFNLPKSLVFSGAGVTERDQREQRRLFTNTALRGFAIQITDELSRLTNWRVSYKYMISDLKYKLSDLREEVQMANLPLSKEEIIEKVNE